MQFYWLIPLRAADNYSWPLKITPELTSKFCDFRNGHFHAGLDIRTQGKTGLSIYAIDDGFIYRAGVSFRGYGKALYLQTNDGRIAVYAHLSGFGEKLEDRIRSTQMEKQKYRQDLFFKSNEFPVKKGQMIGYTGDSGGSTPHLHFEIRSANNRPLNPLEFGFTLPDRTPAFFEKLAIRSYDSNFNPGDPCHIEFIPVDRGFSKGEYAIRDTIISDEIMALAISGGDRINGSGFIYSFFKLELSIDDSLIFVMDSDSISYETTNQIRYIRDQELGLMISGTEKSDVDKDIFYRLYVPPGNDQFFWNGLPSDAGVIAPAFIGGTTRTVTITAYDEIGNKSKLSFYVKTPELAKIRRQDVSYLRRGDIIDINFATDASMANVGIEYRDSIAKKYIPISNKSISTMTKNDVTRYYSVSMNSKSRYRDYRLRYFNIAGKSSPWIYFSENPNSSKLCLTGSPDKLRIEYSDSHSEIIPTISYLYNGQQQSSEMYSIGPNKYAMELLNLKLSGPINFTIRDKDKALIDTQVNLLPIYRGEKTFGYSPDSTLKIISNSSSAFYPDYIYPTNGQTEKIYGVNSVVYDIEPYLLAVKSQLAMVFDIDKLRLSGRKISAYGQSIGTDSWGFIGRLDNGNPQIGAIGLGRIALLEDNDAPSISDIRPNGFIKSGKPILSCKISDNLSGLALDDGIEMTIDNIWVPADYDLNTKIFRYQVRSPLGPGKHKLVINAIDNQGNSVTKSAIFTIMGKY